MRLTPRIEKGGAPLDVALAREGPTKRITPDVQQNKEKSNREVDPTRLET